jgi:hypothetical protein
MADDLMPAQFGHVRFFQYFPFALGNREPNAHELFVGWAPALEGQHA